MADPTVYADRYEILQEIARGGMANVYLAQDRKLDRPVALKVLPAELSRDGTFVERFRLEAQAAASLNDPTIVAVYDWGQEQDTSFIVMEYVEGRTLRDVIARGPDGAGRRPPRSPPTSPRRSAPPTAPGSCTATSSPATCSSTPTAT